MIPVFLTKRGYALVVNGQVTAMYPTRRGIEQVKWIEDLVSFTHPRPIDVQRIRIPVWRRWGVQQAKGQPR